MSLKITKTLWTETHGSLCCCNKAVANDDLLSMFTTNRKVANDSQWQLMVPMVKLPIIPSVPNVLFLRFCARIWICTVLMGKIYAEKLEINTESKIHFSFRIAVQ